MAEKTDEKKSPVFTAGPYSCGPGNIVEAAVWSNEIDVEGGTSTAFGVSFKRSYRSGTTWKTSKSLRVGDIPVLIYALQRCQEFILENGNVESTTDCADALCDVEGIFH
jgi:hypothetical protein